MHILIEIPKEFEMHFENDRFRDSLSRIKHAVVEDRHIICGLYELELMEMLTKAFPNAVCVNVEKTVAAPQIDTSRIMLFNRIDELKKLIELANDCIDDCDYSLTKVPNDRVEDAVNKWQCAYKAYKGEKEDGKRL